MRWLVCAVLSMAPSAALAQAEAAPAVAPAKTAEQLSAEALEAFNAGDMLTAANKFLEAYELSGRHTQLRNAAKSFENANKLANAVDAWERYAAHPEVEADKRAQAKAHAAQLREQMTTALTPLESKPYLHLDPEPRQGDPAEPHVITAPPPPPPERSRALEWSLLGGGGGALVVGQILYWSGMATWFTYDDPATRSQVTREDADAATTRRAIGMGVSIVGAAALAGAGLLFALED